MKRIQIRKITVSFIMVILITVLYSMIFQFSQHDGEKSSSLSHKISKSCVEMVDDIRTMNWSEEKKDDLASDFEHPIRKLAHFVEYFLLGLLQYCLLTQWIDKFKIKFFIAAAWIFISAALDELHQTYVPGRNGCFSDVCLDTLGGVLGMVVIYFSINLLTKLNNKGRIPLV